MTKRLKAAIDKKEQDLNAREATLVLRENDALETVSTYGSLILEIEGSKGAQPGRHHAESFLCPLENIKGERCNRFISLKDDGFDITVHYEHKLSEDEQEVLQDTVNEKLRAAIQAAQHQVASDTAFIRERSHLLSASRPSAPTTSTQTAKITASRKDAVQTSAQQHHHPHSPVIAKTPSLTPNVSNQELPTVSGSATTADDLRTRELARTEVADGNEAAVTTTGLRKARDAVATARRRRISVSEKVFKPLREEESSSESDVPPPPLKKKGRRGKQFPAKTAPVGTSPVTSNKRKQTHDEEEVPVTPKKKSPAIVPPVKRLRAIPAAERKKAEAEEKFTITKNSLRRVTTSSPPRSSAKKIGKAEPAKDSVVVETPKSATRGRKRRKTRLSGGRGPSRV
jgi:hypothetical protein